MLSILIPIYNYNSYPLVQELHKQCLESDIDFEILCQDDASNSSLNVINETINLLSNCSFISLKKNIAHRENRNSLAEQAKYQYLLFVDGDSIIISKKYIQKYLANLFDYDVVYGGRLHPEKCPSDAQKLRWKYGKFIEDKSAEDREKLPYQSLLFNNTIIKKECFNKVKFDKTMKKYGHDDTQLSYELSLLKVNVNHIENPVEHGDIDTNLDYYTKTKESLENLVTLYSENKIDIQFVKIIRVSTFLKTIKATWIISRLYDLLEKSIFRNLMGKNPSLLVFNFFRIGYLCTLNTV